MMKYYDLSRYNGKGIKVAVVDDGISLLHPDVKEIAGGVKIEVDSKDHIIYSGDYLNEDPTSHGTVCAAIIKRKATQAQLYSVKILGDDLCADPRVLIAAIQWAIEKETHLVNLSLGVTGVSHILPLRDVCKAACEKGIVIICAAHPRGQLSYPAAFPEVITVGKNDLYEDYDYTYHPELRTEFIASGVEQTTESIMRGTSVAAAYISAITALVLEKCPLSDLHEVKQALIANACRRKTWMIEEPVPESRRDRPKVGRKWSWINKAALYPYDEKMHAFVRFADMIDFEITHVVDPTHPSLIGKDAGQAIGCQPLGIPILGSLEQAEDADTIIIGRLDRLKKNIKRDVLENVLVWAVEKGKKVFSFSPVEKWMWRNLYQIAHKKKLSLAYPTPKAVEDLFVPGTPPTHVDVPVIGVFGTSFNQGKFTTQLALRSELLCEGYRVAQIGTEPHCELFGFSCYFPNDWEMSVGLPIVEKLVYLENLMLGIYAQEQPDIFIVGCQGAVVPHALYGLADRADFYNYSKTYTLPSIAFLLGTRPDAYILTVNSIDPDEYIQDSIDTLKALGKGKIIAIAFADKIKDAANAYSLYSTWARQMSQEEISMLTSRLEAKFGIPAACPVIEEGRKKLANAIIEYFAAD